MVKLAAMSVSAGVPASSFATSSKRVCLYPRNPLLLQSLLRRESRRSDQRRGGALWAAEPHAGRQLFGRQNAN
jgi:hypothetical protein